MKVSAVIHALCSGPMPFLLATILITLTALAIEACAGYPARIFAAIGHPVTWIGALLERA